MPDLEAIKAAEAARVVAIREALGMTRAEFAARLGFGLSTLSNIEAGRYRMGARRMQLAEQLLAESSYPSGLPPCLEVTESPSRPLVVAPSTAITTALASRVLAAAEDPAVQRAARALSEALGNTEREALAQVIAAKLRE